MNHLGLRQKMENNINVRLRKSRPEFSHCERQATLKKSYPSNIDLPLFTASYRDCKSVIVQRRLSPHSTKHIYHRYQSRPQDEIRIGLFRGC
jgi:hypothetical protein